MCVPVCVVAARGSSKEAISGPAWFAGLRVGRASAVSVMAATFTAPCCSEAAAVRSSFERDGYVVCRGLFNPAASADVRGLIESQVNLLL